MLRNVRSTRGTENKKEIRMWQKKERKRTSAKRERLKEKTHSDVRDERTAEPAWKRRFLVLFVCLFVFFFIFD